MSEQLEKHSPLIDRPYSVGVLLALNAIADAWLLLDAPECAVWKMGFVHGAHDWNSTLWDIEGFHRVHVTCVNTEQIVLSRGADVAERLRRISSLEQCGAVFAVGFPMATISGVQYETIHRGIQPPMEKPFFQIPGGPMVSDWLDGYVNTLRAIAEKIELPPPAPNPDNVAIVGYMMDRNERDHTANLAELKRLLGAIGLSAVSIWLDGGSFNGLREISSAGTILSFPAGREAAEIVARRLGANLVLCDLPFGLKGTSDWLVKVGEATGRKEEAEALVESELRRIMPRLEWVAPEFFQAKKTLFTGDPAFIRPLAALVHELGAKMLFAVATATAARLEAMGTWDDLPFPVYPALTVDEFHSRLNFPLVDVDFTVCASETPRVETLSGKPPPNVELGYPSFTQHAIFDLPYLGYEGCLCFLNRIVNEMMNRF